VSDLLAPASVFLVFVVFLAALIQTTIGFGAMLVSVTLGALVWPIPELTGMLVPLSVVQSGIVVARHRHDVDWRRLFRQILPLMGIGIAITSALTTAEPAPWMKPALGVLVIGLGGREVLRMVAPRPAHATPTAAPSTVAQGLALVAAGLVHGVFATGGPIVVWSLGQDPTVDKATFRTTLTALWMIANAVLAGVFAARGQVDGATLLSTTALVVPALVGIGVGEALHARVDEWRFRLAVWLVVGLAGLPLLA